MNPSTQGAVPGIQGDTGREDNGKHTKGDKGSPPGEPRQTSRLGDNGRHMNPSTQSARHHGGKTTGDTRSETKGVRQASRLGDNAKQMKGDKGRQSKLSAAVLPNEQARDDSAYLPSSHASVQAARFRVWGKSSARATKAVMDSPGRDNRYLIPRLLGSNLASRACQYRLKLRTRSPVVLRPKKKKLGKATRALVSSPLTTYYETCPMPPAPLPPPHRMTPTHAAFPLSPLWVLCGTD